MENLFLYFRSIVHDAKLFLTPNQSPALSVKNQRAKEKTVENQKLVVTLTANRGNRYDENGETIGTHGRSIVFLPKGVKPDEQVRVELVPLHDGAGNERKDGRGRTMYRANPAPDASSEKWKDNGDGTWTRVKIVTDWRCKSREVGVVETRAKQARDGTPHTHATFTVDWGTGRAEAKITISTKTMIPELEERLDPYSGQPQMSEVRRRDGGTVVETHAVEAIEPKYSGYVETNDWLQNRLRASYIGEPNLYIRFKLTYAGDKSVESNSCKFDDLPAWLKAEVEARYPLCTCGRGRMDKPTGKTVCSECDQLQSQVALINAHVSPERRAAIVNFVTLLVAGKAIEGEAGSDILTTTTDHVTAGYATDQLLESFKNYPWYYFADDGVYGSRFSPDALELLAQYDVAVGKALVKWTAWLAGTEHRIKDRYGNEFRQFYLTTQVKGEDETPSLSQYDLENLSVAVRLRGSEADRQVALTGLEMLRGKLGADSKRVIEIENIMQGAEQDYRAALVKILEVKSLIEREAVGEILIGFGGSFRVMGNTGNANYWVIRQDGTLRDADDQIGRRRYEQSEGEKRWEIVVENELAISWRKSDTPSPHDFRVHHRPTTLSLEQAKAVERIERDIAQSWQGRIGMSGKESPGIGDSWGLTPKSPKVGNRQQVVETTNPEPVVYKPAPVPKPAMPPAPPATAEQVATGLAELQAKFSKDNKKRK